MHSRILVIPDVHLPFQRKTFLKDLAKITSKYRPNKFVIIGDAIDSHAVSNHLPEPDALDATSEFTKVKESIAKMAKVFGKKHVYYCVGNHDRRIAKAAAAVRIPSICLKSLKEVFGMPKHWQLGLEHIVDGIMFTHHKSNVSGKACMSYGMPVVQGHMHAKLSIEYFTSPKLTLWQAQAGSAVDDASIAMNYAKNALGKSSYGFIFIDKSGPRLIKL